MGVAWLGVPAVVMTLGMNGVLQGLTLGLSKGLTCAVVRLLRAGSRCATSSPAGCSACPPNCFVWAGVALLMTVLLTLTTFGRRVYAVGVNPRAAFLAGVGVRGVTVALYTLSGVFAALAGIALVAYGGQPSLGLGDPYLFESIAAVVVGGVSILGGRGHYARRGRRLAHAGRRRHVPAGAAGARVRPPHHLRPGHPRDPLHLRPGASAHD